MPGSVSTITSALDASSTSSETRVAFDEGHDAFQCTRRSPFAGRSRGTPQSRSNARILKNAANASSHHANIERRCSPTTTKQSTRHTSANQRRGIHHMVCRNATRSVNNSETTNTATDRSAAHAAIRATYHSTRSNPLTVATPSYAFQSRAQRALLLQPRQRCLQPRPRHDQCSTATGSHQSSAHARPLRLR